jgi:predicted glycogen debranching enzyme
MTEPRQLSIPWAHGRAPEFLRDREWLVTNGLGGFSSGTLAGMPTRKYHGLFVPNLAAPKGRHIVISRCDEFVTIGEDRIHLGGAEFASDHSVGESHRYLKEFRVDHRIAVWVFEIGSRTIEKSIVMPHNQNTVCVRYRLLAGDPVELHVRPYLSFRRQDEQPDQQLQNIFSLNVARNRHEIRRSDSSIVLRLNMQPGPAAFVTEERSESDFFYRIDHDRGDAHFESAHSLGYFLARIQTAKPAVFVASTHSWESLQFDGNAVFDAEARRLDGLLSLSPRVAADPFARQLAMAADQFIVLPGARLEETVLAQAEGSELRTVIAGYHWFGDWGRDTMISLEGLALCTGRYREAGAILRTFANYVRDGLLPNLFPEGDRAALYHTVDATLWYFHAIARYVAATGDETIISHLYPVLESIVQHHIQGTHYNIHVDEDSLVTAAAEGYQLTWMDAKVDGWVVTPRRGKPVEIQALWHNALRLMAQWARRTQRPSEQYEQLATRVYDSFNRRFWNQERGCLFDVVDGPQGDDSAIRPNQVFAISLDHPVLDPRHWATLVDLVRHALVTPYGVRTLSADHPDYRAHYRGNLRERDAAYHQGTVWPWLIGHFIDAFLKVRPDERAVARGFLKHFEQHLLDAGVGSISEVFDGESPCRPGGCIAQAWSVAEVLRAWVRTSGTD